MKAYGKKRREEAFQRKSVKHRKIFCSCCHLGYHKDKTKVYKKRARQDNKKACEE